MSATMRMSLSLCLQRPTTRGSWTEEKYGAVSIVCGYLCQENTTEPDFDVGALSSNTPYSGGGLPTYIGLRVNLYRARREAILVVASTYIGRSSDLYRFHTPLPDMPLRSDTQALRLIASIPLVQRSEKHRSREEKSVFP